jgi:transcriptional regulator
VLENTINYYEASYKQQWNKFPDDDKAKMGKGIVDFEITVNDLQTKKKLGQTGSTQRSKKSLTRYQKVVTQTNK